MDLVTEIFKLNDELSASIRKLADNGKRKAEAERDYKITLRTEALKLRQEKGLPVTLIAQIVYGVPKVAELRFARDIAETMYQTNLEHINVTKLKLRILENQVQREWGAKGDV